MNAPLLGKEGHCIPPFSDDRNDGVHEARPNPRSSFHVVPCDPCISILHRFNLQSPVRAEFFHWRGSDGPRPTATGWVRREKCETMCSIFLPGPLALNLQTHARSTFVPSFFSSPSLGMPSIHGNAGPVHVSNSSIRLISRAFPLHGARAAFLLRAVPIFPHTPRLFRASHGSAAVLRPRVTVGTVGRVRGLLLSWDVWLRRLGAHPSPLRHVVHVEGSDETCGDE